MLRIFCSALACLLSVPGLAADTISATHVFPASLIYSRSFLEFVKKANEAGKGEFTIQVRGGPEAIRSEEHTSELQSHHDLVCRLLLEKKKNNKNIYLTNVNK